MVYLPTVYVFLHLVDLWAWYSFPVTDPSMDPMVH